MQANGTKLKTFECCMKIGLLGSSSNFVIYNYRDQYHAKIVPISFNWNLDCKINLKKAKWHFQINLKVFGVADDFGDGVLLVDETNVKDSEISGSV